MKKIGASIILCLLVIALALPGLAQEEKDLLESKCTGCHSLKVVYKAKKDKDAWLITIERMVDKGASLSLEEQEALADYLSQQ